MVSPLLATFWRARLTRFTLMMQGVVSRAEPKKLKKKKSSKSQKEKKVKKSKKSKSSSSISSSTNVNEGDYAPPEAEADADKNDNDINDNVNENDTATNECSDTVLAIAPKEYCNDWIPGIGRRECDNDDSRKRGGEVCNIVSKAWLRALVIQECKEADLVLNHAGVCQAAIDKGAVTQSDVDDVLPNGFDVMLVQMTGREIQLALQQGAKAAYDGNPKAYPYGYGIRFSVDYANRSRDQGFVYNIQVKPGGEGSADAWTDIVDTKTYRVVTNSKLSNGESGYGVFLDIPADKKEPLYYTDADLFVKYAKRKCELDGAPYSTYSFQGLDVLLTGQYQCLEDNSLCECGYC